MNQLSLNHQDLLGWAHGQPWFEVLYKTPQDPEWHAEGNVGIHTEMVMDAYWGSLPSGPSRAQQLTGLAALLHDIGKPACTTEENGRIVSPRHGLKGSRIVQALLRDLLPPPERHFVVELVRLHGHPPFAWEDAVYTAVMSHCVSLESLHALVLADAKGRTSAQPTDMLDRIELWWGLAHDLKCTQSPYAFDHPNTRIRAFTKDLKVIPSAPIYHHAFKSKVHFVLGLPGAGKDTYIKKHYPTLPVISLDDLKREKKVKYGDQEAEGRIIQHAQELFREQLRQGSEFVLNMTNVTRSLRSKWVQLAWDYNAHCHGVYIEPPFTTLAKQNRNRTHAIPHAALENLFSILEVPSVGEFHTLDYIW